MSVKTDTSPACTRCKKELLTHLQFHTLKSVGVGGSLEIDCHPEPHAKLGDALKYVLEHRAAALVAQAELKAAHKKFATDLQSAVAEAERRLDTKAHTKAAELAAAEIAVKEAGHKQALADCERTRVVAESTHTAKVTYLEDVLKEVRGDKQTLLTEKQALADKLTASEKATFDLRLEVDELKEELIEERRQHEDLKQEAKEVLRLAFTVGKHAKAIGRKLGVYDESDLKKLFTKPTVPPVPVAPPPVPMPAPKAEVVTAHVAVPEAAPAPVPQTVTVMLDAPTPEPDASASADDDGEDDEASDDEVVEELEAGSDASDEVSFEEEGSSEDDDVSSEEVAPEECSGCEKVATHGFDFNKKDGSQDRLTTCNPRKHVPEFLQHLQDEAAVDSEGVLKTMPRTAGELVTLLKANPIKKSNA